MNKLHKLLIIALILIVGGNTLKAEHLNATCNSETELVTKNQDLHSHDNFITDDNHVVSALAASAAYNGTPVTPTKINESNYQLLGLTEENWSTYNGYYAIRNASELYGFAALVNGGNRSVNGVLLQDIVVNTSVSASGATYSWTPIGATRETAFLGTFDGAGHSISGIYYKNADATHVGLFGNIGEYGEYTNAAVKNLILKNSYIYGKQYVGGIAGCLWGENVKVTNCKTDSDVSVVSAHVYGDNLNFYAGGIVGSHYGTTMGYTNYVTNCVSFASVTGTFLEMPENYGLQYEDNYIAAITGSWQSGINGGERVTVRNCYYLKNSVKVTAGDRMIYANWGRGGGRQWTDGAGWLPWQDNVYCTILESASAPHTCVAVATPEIKANCTYGGHSAYSYCLICGGVTNGTKNLTEANDTHFYKGATCTVNGVCQLCGDANGPKDPDNHVGGWDAANCIAPATCVSCSATKGEKDPHNHTDAGKYTYTVNANDESKHDAFYEQCKAFSHTEGHSYDAQGKCTKCTYECAHPTFTDGVCTICETYQPATLVTNENYESLGLAAEYVGFYQIGNAGQLYWFANHINTVDRTASAVLTADIDLEGKPDGTGRKWTPIGSTGENSNNFRGVFDGQNHTITGLYVEGGRAGLGFFGEVRTGTVKNFTIYGEVVVNTEVDYVGGVIGSTCGLNGSDHGLERNGATVQNITSYVNLTAKTHGIGRIGGFIGYANHETLIENCSWHGTFDAGIYRVDSGAGGFIGRIYDSAKVTIRNCAAYGTIMTSYKSGTFNNQNTIYIGGFLSHSPSGAQTVMQNNLWAGEIINNTDLEASNAHLSAFGTMTSFQSITNCYALNSTPYVTTNNENDNAITTVTAERLASGEIAYLLQGEQETQVWGQNIDNGETADAYPVLGGAKVYKYTFDFGNINVYSNLETLDMTPHGKCGDYLYWNITDNTLTIFGTGAMYDYSHSGNQVSPWKNINPKPTSLILEEGMTSIGEYAFYNCSTLSGNLIFPSTVTNIGKYAFYNCNKLSGDLTIPNSVTSIGKTAFYGCSGLDGVLTISNNITAINEETFTNCYNLTGDLIIPDGVTYIGKKAFYNCNKLSGNLIIPSGVTSIETETFYRCYALSGNLTIPGNVVSIGTYAFQDCNGFTSLTIEEGVQTIAGSAFYGCSGMKGNLRIPNSVTSIGSRAFYSCGLDGELIISHCITSIGDFVFYGTKFSNLVFEDLPDKKSQLTSIGSSAFYMCSSLNNELIIPNSVTSIGTSAFNGCTKLTSIFMYRESALDIGTNAFDKTNSATIYAPVIWSSFDNIPETQLVKMPTYTSQQVDETTSQQVWVGLAEGQTEPGENDHVAINAPLLLSQRDNETTSQQVNSLRVKSFGYCGDGTTTNGSITIEEGGQLYCETARGEVTVRKEILGYQQSGSESEWYTIASPLKDVTSTSSVSGLLTTESDYDLYRYDEPTHTWQNAKPGEGSTNFQTIEPGRGYLYANAENTTLEFKGNINTEDVNCTLTAQSEVLNGFHLVGNPFTHDISFNHLSADAELANGYYVLKGEGAWGATLGNEGDVIKVGQGALIKTTSAGTLMIFKSTSQQDNESTSRDASNMYRSRRVAESPSRQVLKLSVANSNYSDKAFVVFDKGVGLDKINHENENIPLLYIPQDGTDYAIAMMDENVSEIPVSFEAMTMGQYTISLQQKNCDFDELYLLDKETGEKVNILEEDYTFMATTADNAERFVLLKDNGQQPTANSSHFAYVSGEDLIISVEGAVQIIDVMGRIIYSNDVTSDNSRIDVSGFDNAAYIVRVVNENGVKVQKVVIY